MSEPSAQPTLRRGINVGRFGAVDSTRLPPLVSVAAVTTTLAVAATAWAGPEFLSGLLAVLALILALGWPVLNSAAGLPQVQLGMAVGGLLVAGAAGLTTGPQRLVWLPVAVAIGMIVSFFLQLLRSDDRHDLTSAMGVAMTGLASAASGAALVPLTLAEAGVRFLVVGLAGLVVGTVAELSGRVRRIGAKAVFLVMLGGALGGWLAAVVAAVPASAGVGLGMLLASFSYSARRIFGAVPGAREPAGQVALGVGSVLWPGVLVLALGVIARVAPS